MTASVRACRSPSPASPACEDMSPAACLVMHPNVTCSLTAWCGDTGCAITLEAHALLHAHPDEGQQGAARCGLHPQQGPQLPTHLGPRLPGRREGCWNEALAHGTACPAAQLPGSRSAASACMAAIKWMVPCILALCTAQQVRCSDCMGSSCQGVLCLLSQPSVEWQSCTCILTVATRLLLAADCSRGMT